MWPNPQETAGSVTFTEKDFNGKLHFLCSVKNCLLMGLAFGIKIDKQLFEKQKTKN